VIKNLEQNQLVRERCVYGIFSSAGTLVYVGQCYVELLVNRLYRHRRKSYREVNFPKWRWLRENLDAEIKIISGPFVTLTETNEEERKQISLARGPLFNLTPGGDYNPMTDPDPVKRQMFIDRVRKSATGRLMSVKAKEKIRNYVLANPSPGFNGRKHTLETKEKMRLARLGRPSAKKGKKDKKMTEETKAKMRASAKAAWAKRKAEQNLSS
jgi:hypothetical protein